MTHDDTKNLHEFPFSHLQMHRMTISHFRLFNNVAELISRTEKHDRYITFTGLHHAYN